MPTLFLHNYDVFDKNSVGCNIVMRALKVFTSTFCCTSILLYIIQELLLYTFERECLTARLLSKVQLSADRSPDGESGGVVSPVIHVITWSRKRSVQKPLLHRLLNTLATVTDIHWLLVENATNTSQWLSDLLMTSPVPVTHLATWSDVTQYPVTQINYALTHLLTSYPLSADDVIYFADEETTIDRQLFGAIRSTREVSLTPVGLVPPFGVITPVVSQGHIVGFTPSKRQTKSNMLRSAGDDVSQVTLPLASIAVSVDYWLLHNVPYMFAHNSLTGSDFIHRLTGGNLSHIHPDTSLCTKVYVWLYNPRYKPTVRATWTLTDFVDSNIPKLIGDVIFDNDTLPAADVTTRDPRHL